MYDSERVINNSMLHTYGFSNGTSELVKDIKEQMDTLNYISKRFEKIEARERYIRTTRNLAIFFQIIYVLITIATYYMRR